ncbi:MAG: VOC family protein [Terricaulis sp.]|nr:VOC family protein [Terricaulis sp.]
MSVDQATRPSRVRHYVIATHDRHFVCDQIYEFLGLPATPARPGPGVTEQYGFYSVMMRVGTTMLEVVQPVRDDHLLSRWFQERGGDGGFMVVMQTYDGEALKARAAAEGLVLTRDQDFMGQHMIQFDYRHFATHFEFYRYTPEDNWWGNPLTGPYSDARVASDVVGCQVAVDDPDAIAAQAARVFLGQQQGRRVNFIDRHIDFVPARGQWRGLTALDLKAKQENRVGDWARIANIQFNLV